MCTGKKTGILFDLDGTLLDTLDDLTDATNFTLRHFGCPERSREEMRRIVGNGALRQMTLALPGKDTDPDVQTVLKFYKAYYNDHCRIKTKPYDGIPEAVEKLKQYPIAIVSNKPDTAVKPLCGEFFPGIYAQGETPDCPRKPAPDMLFRAMETIGVERCIYVGDSEVDLLTSKNAGVECIAVLWGFRDKEMLLENGAIHLCETPEQMVQMLEAMLRSLST